MMVVAAVRDVVSTGKFCGRSGRCRTSPRVVGRRRRCRSGPDQVDAAGRRWKIALPRTLLPLVPRRHVHAGAVVAGDDVAGAGAGAADGVAVRAVIKATPSCCRRAAVPVGIGADAVARTMLPVVAARREMWTPFARVAGDDVAGAGGGAADGVGRRCRC